MRWRDEVCLWLAVRMPRRLRYWTTVIAGCEANSGQWESTAPTETTIVDVLKRIEPV